MSVKDASAAWGVSETEYLRYQSIMAGPRGTWTPNADPLLALGTHATSATQMRAYAEQYVRQEFERTERELAFQREVSAAWARLFPGQARIAELPRARHASTSRTSSPVVDRAAVVVTRECQQCTTAVQFYLGVVSRDSPIKAVDIYISDSGGDDKVLRDWVDSNAVSIALLQTGKVTVNHGESHSAITQFPTVFERQVDGQWHPKSAF